MEHGGPKKPDHEIVKGDLGFGPGPQEDFDVGVYGAHGELEEGVYVGGGLLAYSAQQGPVAVDGRGPNVGIGVGLTKNDDVRVMAKAELASTSVSVGPAQATVGLSADTGVGIGPSGVEAKVLGTGFSAGKDGIGVSLLGSGFKLKFW